MRNWIIAGLLVAPVALAAQSADGTDEAAHATVRAAGMPLRDGALEPGTLTVRVVRGDFSNNLPNQPVTVQIGGRVLSATTGSDGRAQFAHIDIGAQVKASAVVEGETLESETFPVPAESGVRVLLVAGGDGTPAPAHAVDMSALPPPAVVDAAPTQTAPPAERDTTVVMMKTALACTTLFVLALVFLQKRGKALG